ncbi:MAG TPA: AMP phosphorylase [Candidatus Nanoarchaeia archaeon]|nr:AMP phosphorylase [Candidatus Nanoarchaeia archaeon]
MKLKIRDMDLTTGDSLVAIMHKDDASMLDLHPLDRVKIKKGRKLATVIIDIGASSKSIKRGIVGVFDEVVEELNLKDGEWVEVIPARKPLSLEYIKKKLEGHKLIKEEIDQIVWDIVHNKLSSIELTYFVSACYANELDVEETMLLTKAMTDHGQKLKLNKYPVLDKHCIGGVAGNRTTPIVVSIVAAAGFAIPKTSSRSITSPAGTADTMEVLTPVSLSLKKMKQVVEKTNGCFVWGGALDLAPADDKIIRVERPLSIDAKSQLLASVMAKKASVSATHLLIDIPCGKGSKIESTKKAKDLKKDFEGLSKKLGIKVRVVLTDGTQPIGNGIGPALEARDILYVLTNDSKAPKDLRSKSVKLAGLMLSLAGKKNGTKAALKLLSSGAAHRKFLEIIKAQGGSEMQPDMIATGSLTHDIKTGSSGIIKSVSNEVISKIARIAGAPENKKAGVYLYKHVGDKVKKGELVYTIYSDASLKMQQAVAITKKMCGVLIQ